MLTVDEALVKLQQHGITDSEQMVRRWLRQGKIKGQRSENRKEGWRIPEDELDRFIKEMDPATKYQEEIEYLRARVDRLEKENRELKKENQELKSKSESIKTNITNSNNMPSNIVPIELTRREVDMIWSNVVEKVVEKMKYEPERLPILEEAYNSLYKGIFNGKEDNRTNLYNKDYDRYVCPFRGPRYRYKKPEELVKKAIPWLIEQTRARHERKKEKEADKALEEHHKPYM